MTKEEYSELLKHPLWKERRKPIPKRDNYTCVKCGNTKYLQVHHTEYELNKLPWEYDNDKLITLCRDCHKKEHNINDTFFQPQPKDKFFITYTDNLLSYIINLTNSDKKVLFFLCSKMEYDTGKVKISPTDKIEYCNILDLSGQQFSNSLSKLKKIKLLMGNRGFYVINPSVFWKGTTESRLKLLNNETFIYWL